MRVQATALLHPAAVLRGQWSLGPAQAAVLQRVLKAPTSPTLDVTRPPPGSVLFPTLSQVQAFVDAASKADCLGIDIENAGRFIICVGMTTVHQDEPTTSLCLRFRCQNGVRYWPSYGDHLKATEYLYQILASPVPKVFHNGISYDVPMLMEHGFEVAPPILDTLLMQNLAYSEMPKGLEFCANLYLGMPHWKWLVGQEDESEGKY